MEVIYLKEGEQFYQSKPIVGAIGFLMVCILVIWHWFMR